MGGPVWARWCFAALLAVICVSCVVRLTAARAHRPSPASDDLGQALMGLGMIAMFASVSGALPKTVLVVVFGASAAGFAGLLARGVPCGERETWECVHHVVASVAMVYMALAATGPRMAVPSLAGAFGVYFLAYAGWAGLRMAGAPQMAVGTGVAGVLRRPRVVEACRAGMGLSMAYLLLGAM
jgi:hypothetical protein